MQIHPDILAQVFSADREHHQKRPVQIIPKCDQLPGLEWNALGIYRLCEQPSSKPRRRCLSILHLRFHLGNGFLDAWPLFFKGVALP